MPIKDFKKNITSELVLLVLLLVASLIFFVEPIIQEYPDDARVFPQLTAAAVFIGSALLLFQNYLPGPIQAFVSENVSIMSDEPDLDGDDETEHQEEEETPKETLGTKYGYQVNDTAFMIGTAVLFFIAGWAVGLLFVTPVYVLLYMLWYRVDVVTSILLAILATVIMYMFVWALLMPFDQGNILNFSPFLPLQLDGLAMELPWGEI